MGPTPRQIESEVQLLVEGKGPAGFFEALIEHLALENLQIQNFGSVTELRSFLPAFVKMSDFLRVKSVGIVRDAETNATGAFNSVQGCLARAGLPVPNVTGERVGADPAITVMILPAADQTGMLETLLCETFGDEDVCTCIDRFFECVEELQREAVHKPFKARARAYLATKRDPDLSVGVAAKRGYWNLEHPVLQPLRTFLSEIAVTR